MAAPELAGPAMVAHGVASMMKNARAVKDLATTGSANPDQLEAFFSGGAEATGGAATTRAAVTSPEPTATGNLVRAANRTLIKGEPPQWKVPEAEKALVQATQPGVNIPRAPQTIPKAGARIQRMMQDGELSRADGSPITEIKSTSDLLEAIRPAKKGVLAAIKQRFGTSGELQTDTSGVADAMEKSISRRTGKQFPSSAAAIRQRASTYREPMTLDQVEDAIQDANNDLRNFYKRSGPTDSPISPDIAATQAEVKALRDLLDEKVEALNGKGVKDLKSEYGALRDLERATAKQHAVATRTKEGGLWEGLAWLHAAGDLISGDVLGATRAGGMLTVGRMLKTLRDPNFLIEQSFHGPKAFAPADAFEPAPGPNIRALLPENAGPRGTNDPTAGERAPYTPWASEKPEAIPQPRSSVDRGAPSIRVNRNPWGATEKAGQPNAPGEAITVHPNPSLRFSPETGPNAPPIDVEHFDRFEPGLSNKNPLRSSGRTIITPRPAVEDISGPRELNAGPQQNTRMLMGAARKALPPVNPRNASGAIEAGASDPPEFFNEPTETAGKTPAETSAKLSPGTQATEIRRLQNRERELIDQSSRSRNWVNGQKLIKQARAVNERWNAMKNTGAAPSDELVKKAFSMATKTEKAAAGSLEVYKKLPPEIKEAVDAQAKEIPHMPQVLREGRLRELESYGEKGSLLKEKLAREAMKQENQRGNQREPGED